MINTQQSRELAMTRWRLTASGAMRLRSAAPSRLPEGSPSLDLAAAARVLELAAIALLVAGLVVACL